MSKLDEANKIGSFVSNWGKIGVVVGGAIVSCTIAYWMIIDNTKNIEQERKDRLDAAIIQENRSDNRFNRAMEIAKELKEQGAKKETELKEIISKESDRTRALQIEVAYMKGKYESAKTK